MKNNYNWIFFVVIIVLLIYLIQNPQILKPQEIESQNLEINVQESPRYDSCNSLCISQDWFEGYVANSIDSCKAGEAYFTYGYVGESPLLKCCCYKKPEVIPEHTCVDTDGGNNKDVPGTVTYNNIDKYMDYCFDATTVYEYRCFDDNTWGGRKIDCDLGQTCLSSRSGGYCKTKSWNPGDTVWSGSGAASMIGITPQTNSIDLSEYGIGIDGNCRLGVQFSTSWIYANDKCVGIPGMQGVKWDLYDSKGLEYSRIDTSPIGLGVDLHPPNHYLDWDGYTSWVASMTPYPFPYNDCSITYEWTARIYIYDCL